MNNNMNKAMLMAALLLTVLTTRSVAQDSTTFRKLSLDEAVQLGIKNSNNLKVSKARIDEAVADLQQAKDAQLPGLSVSGSYLRLSSANIDLKSSNDNGGGSNGGETPSPNQAMYGIVNVSLPLYAGGRIKYGIESAKYLQQAALLDEADDKEAIALNTAAAYVNLYKAAAAVAIVKQNLSTSLSRDSSFINLEKNGVMARNDLLKSQLQTSNIELALLDAQNNLKLATINMNLMLGLPENDGIEIDSSFIDNTPSVKNFRDYETLAFQNRKDAQAVALRKKAAVTGLKSARAEAYPTLALTGGYVAADIPKVLTITNAVNFGIGVQYNLASLWKKNTSLMRAQARQATVDANEEMLGDNIRYEVNKNYQNYLLSVKKINVYEKANEQATENFRITNNKYNNSLATITDLLEANASLLQSALNVQSAKADAMLAYQSLLRSTGTNQQYYSEKTDK